MIGGFSECDEGLGIGPQPRELRSSLSRLDGIHVVTPLTAIYSPESPASRTFQAGANRRNHALDVERWRTGNSCRRFASKHLRRGRWFQIQLGTHAVDQGIHFEGLRNEIIRPGEFQLLNLVFF